MQEIADLWIWIICWAGAVSGGFVMGFAVGRARGAKNYLMITKHLREVLDSREDADTELDLIRTTINAIKEGSE